MKSKIKSLSLVCVLLLIVGCNEQKDFDKSSEILFFQVKSIEYNNGCVYNEKPAKYLDFETLESSPLCAVPNCTHKDSKCLANMVGDTPVFYNNYIYFFESNYGAVRETQNGREFYIDSKLKKASLDSSEIEIVCEFSDCAPEKSYAGITLKGNEIYFTGNNLNPKKSEYGDYGWGNSGGYHYLCSINLDTGEYKNYGSIYDGDKEYEGADYSSCANITGTYNDKMYIRYSFIKDNDAFQNGGNPDELYEHINFEFDFDRKEWKEAELPFSWYMNNDTYTYYDALSKEEHIIYKGNEKIFPNDNAHIQLKEFNGKLFLTDEGKFYDLNTMVEYNMGEYSEYQIMGYSNGNYILKNSKKAVKITEEELLSFDKE